MRGFFFAVLLQAHRRALDARRAGRRTSFLLWSAAAGLCGAAAIVSMVSLLTLFWLVGWWWLAVPLAFWSLTPVAADLVAEHLAVPWGAARAAHYLGRRSPASGLDPEAAALVWAARAAACRPSPAAIAWVEARRVARGRTGDAEVVATGLLLAARGDRAGAHALVESAGELAELHPAVRELAGEWLAADDAERGAWAAIRARAADPARWPATPTTFLLEGVAARLAPGAASADAALPGRANLVLRWLEAPRRMVTWPLVARALAARAERAAPAVSVAPRAPTPIRATAPAASGGDAADDRAAPRASLDAAKAAHVALARGDVTAPAIAAAAAAWDRALADADTRIGVLSRAAALGAPADAGDRALRELGAAAAADLAELAQAHGVPLAALALVDARSSVLADASARIRHRLLGELELAFARLADRASARDALPAIDEWRALCALRADYERAAAAGGLELRRLAFVHAHTAVGRVAVWLWNDRGEHVLSHAMTSWLAAEARAVGDAHAVETHTNNARLRIPFRAGKPTWWRRAGTWVSKR